MPFEWGTESPGVRHLAEALLIDLAGPKTPRFLTHHFAREVVSKLPPDWEIRSEEIEKWLKIRGEAGGAVKQQIYAPFRLSESPPLSIRSGDFPTFPVDPSKQNHPDWLDDLRQRIQPEELEKQGFPRPKDVRLSRGADSAGEDAFYVYLVFPDKTPEKALAWEKIEPMVSWVRNLIWTATGARLWPYVKVKRQKELTGGVS